MDDQAQTEPITDLALGTDPAEPPLIGAELHADRELEPIVALN